MYRYLSRLNANPRLETGVRKDGADLDGHAWVVVDGEPVYEKPVELEPFVRVVSFGARGARETA
jgi:hypothetical protein